MTRKGLERIIKERSAWTIDKRKGDYALPGGGMLSDYVFSLVTEQLNLDGLGFRKSGELATYDHDNERLIIVSGEDEPTNWGEQYKRKVFFVHEMIWRRLV